MGCHQRRLGPNREAVPHVVQSAIERCSEDGSSIAVSALLSYRSGGPTNHHRNTMIHHHGMEAPVQVINVPVRAVPTYGNNDSVFDEKHAVERLEALSLKERVHHQQEDNLKENGSIEKVVPAHVPSHAIKVEPVEEDEDSDDSPAAQSPMSPPVRVIPAAVTSSTCLVPPMAAAVLSSSSVSLSYPTSEPPRLPAQSSSGDSVASSTASFQSQRQMFLMFIKILFKCLDQANQPEVRDKAKKIVALCTQRNRMCDPAFTPLMEAVEKRLRGFVGEVLWRRALLLLHHYLSKNKNGSTASAA